MQANLKANGLRDDALVLSIDIGSSSLRATLYGRDAEPVEGCSTQTGYSLKLTPDGGAEIDPATLLEQAAAAITSTLGKAGERAKQIVGVGMCSLAGNVVGVDGEGWPTTPIYTWADTRCAAEAHELCATLDAEAIRQRTGCPIHTAYLPPRLLWLKRTAPAGFDKTARWLTIGDWLLHNMLGKTVQSYAVAAWNGLLDRHALAWDKEWLAYLDLDVIKLPQLGGEHEKLQGLASEYAEKWPALQNVPWFPCTGDGVASNLGSGCWTEDMLAVQVGTSGAMRAMQHGTVPDVPAGLWCYGLGEGASLIGGALSEGGNIFAWLRGTLKVDDWDALEQRVAAMPPDSHGLTLLPFLAGERSPGWNPLARGAISGLTLSTDAAGITRAAQEAIMYRFRFIYDRLRTVLSAPQAVVASGAALLNTPGWIAMLADVLGVPVTASGEKEATSTGVAMLTLHALGLIKDYSAVQVPFGRTYMPDMGRHAVYRRAMERQGKLYDAVGLGVRG